MAPLEVQSKLQRYFKRDLEVNNREIGDIPLNYLIEKVMLVKLPSYVRPSLLQWGIIISFLPFFSKNNKAY